jgi:hypothetical protein
MRSSSTGSTVAAIAVHPHPARLPGAPACLGMSMIPHRDGPARHAPNDFASLAEAEAALLAFQDHYQQIATPFEWKFTTSDLDLLLKRLASHEPAPALAA